MGKHVHVLSDVDLAAMTATCAACGPVGIHSIGVGKVRCARGPRKRSARPIGARADVSDYHRLTERDTATLTASCSICGPGVPMAKRRSPYTPDGWGYVCKRARRARARGAAGITSAEREELLAAQGGRCAICGTTEPDSGRWCADHCHATGRVRGVLCHHCNAGLGLFRDSTAALEAAIIYLRRAGGGQ